MKKPEKKKLNSKKIIKKHSSDILIAQAYGHKTGYNQAIDDYEKFLPSEKDIMEILKSHENYRYEIEDKATLAKVLKMRVE